MSYNISCQALGIRVIHLQHFMYRREERHIARGTMDVVDQEGLLLDLEASRSHVVLSHARHVVRRAM